MKYFDEEDVIAEYEKQLQKKDKEIERLHSIIKEVRECLNKNRVYITGERHLVFEIEEILDKENI